MPIDDALRLRANCHRQFNTLLSTVRSTGIIVSDESRTSGAVHYFNSTRPDPTRLGNALAGVFGKEERKLFRTRATSFLSITQSVLTKELLQRARALTTGGAIFKRQTICKDLVSNVAAFKDMRGAHRRDASPLLPVCTVCRAGIMAIFVNLSSLVAELVRTIHVHLQTQLTSSFHVAAKIWVRVDV